MFRLLSREQCTIVPGGLMASSMPSCMDVRCCVSSIIVAVVVDTRHSLTRELVDLDVSSDAGEHHSLQCQERGLDRVPQGAPQHLALVSEWPHFVRRWLWHICRRSGTHGRHRTWPRRHEDRA
mgnify:CR=1 FL=1